MYSDGRSQAVANRPEADNHLGRAKGRSKLIHGYHVHFCRLYREKTTSFPVWVNDLNSKIFAAHDHCQ